MFKKLVTLFTICFLLFGSAALAAPVDERYQGDCPSSPNGLHYCYMTNGYNVVYVGESKPFGRWQLYTCKHCHSEILTEGQPHFHMTIHRYVSSSEGGRIDFNGAGNIFIYPEDIQYCDSQYLEGYRFYGRLN